MKNILLVEDESGHAELISRALARSSEPMNVTLAHTLKEARAHLASLKPDLALVDYRLPDGLGDQLVEMAGSAFPVVLMTAFGSERTAVEAIKAGALDYVVKSPEMFGDMPHLVARSLREWQNLQERKRADARLEAINQLLVTLGQDFVENANRLLAMLGQELGARTAIYSRIEGKSRHAVGSWQAPDSMHTCCGEPPCCRLCEDLPRDAGGETLFVEDLRNTADRELASILQPLGLQTYLGRTIRCGGRQAGMLCVFFDQPYTPSEADKRLLGILASALSSEENHHRAEQTRARLESQLRQAQKMEAVGTLAGGIAHDFNNILTGILGNTELARFDLPENHPSHEALDELLRAAHRARDLVSQILTFSRQREQKRAVVQLWPVVCEVLKLLRASLPATIEINTHTAPQCPSVLADPSQIHQVVMNLCTNAAQAMSEKGGTLEVKQSAVDVDTDIATMNPQLRTGRYICLSVTDTGHGMDAVTLERIFEPFFTTKPPGQGTGLGLSVVHGIMQNHDGAITVYSEPGAGTTFNLYFPAVESEATSTPAALKSLPTGNGQHVLFVDDEAAVVQLGSSILIRAGYVVTGTTNPREALGLFMAAPEKFDLVITDLTMPRMTGTALSAELLRVRPDLPVILITGFASGMDDSKARELGIRALLHKPFSMHELAGVLRSIFVTGTEEQV
jgi:signal transduction histidine kinase/DNA-binding response OmpR family regulator